MRRFNAPEESRPDTTPAKPERKPPLWTVWRRDCRKHSWVAVITTDDVLQAAGMTDDHGNVIMRPAGLDPNEKKGPKPKKPRVKNS